MTHADRWWATYNAAVVGFATRRHHCEVETQTIHDAATAQANMAHGDLGLTPLARYERNIMRVEEVLNSPEAAALAIDDVEGDRQELLRLLSTALLEEP